MQKMVFFNRNLWIFFDWAETNWERIVQIFTYTHPDHSKVDVVDSLDQFEHIVDSQSTCVYPENNYGQDFEGSFQKTSQKMWFQSFIRELVRKSHPVSTESVFFGFPPTLVKAYPLNIVAMTSMFRRHVK